MASDKYDPLVDLEDRGKVFRYDNTVTTSAYDIYLGNGIASPGEYMEILNLLRNINKPHNTELVTIHLMNFGGSCDGLISLVNAVRNCEAPVLFRVEGRCASAGSTLALCGDYLLMEPHTELMFHNYSSVDTGKGHELRLSVDNGREWVYKYYNDIHRPFLTKAECNKIERDQDIYVKWNDSDLQVRIDRHFKGKRHEIKVSKK
jgi:ATP-dependent protease ClpP protease subunit